MSLDDLQRLVLDVAAPPGEWRGDISEDEYEWQISSMDVNVRVRLPLREVHDDSAAAFADAVAVKDAIVNLGFVLHSRCELSAIGATEDDESVVGWRGYLELGLRTAQER